MTTLIMKHGREPGRYDRARMERMKQSAIDKGIWIPKGYTPRSIFIDELDEQ